jgi:hypothetical protein
MLQPILCVLEEIANMQTKTSPEDEGGWNRQLGED